MLWDVSNGRKALDLEFAGTPWRLAFTPDGQHLAVLSEGVVKLWDVVSGQAISTTYAVGGTVMAFSPNGKYLAGASRDKAMVLEIASGQTVLTLQGHTKGVYDVTFSPDGKRLATASADKTVKLWDAVTGQELLTLKGHTNFVYTVVFSPDGKRLASGDIDSALTNTTSTIIIWDASKSMDALDPVKNLY
jgi:WD40 repeat protein